MTFREAEEHLLGLELFGMKFGLERMHRLMTALGQAERAHQPVHPVQAELHPEQLEAEQVILGLAEGHPRLSRARR